jgi:hypothetical protein
MIALAASVYNGGGANTSGAEGPAFRPAGEDDMTHIA